MAFEGVSGLDPLTKEGGSVEKRVSRYSSRVQFTLAEEHDSLQRVPAEGAYLIISNRKCQNQKTTMMKMIVIRDLPLCYHMKAVTFSEVLIC